MPMDNRNVRDYIYPIDNRCSVTIPGSLHGCQTQEVTVFFADHWPGHTVCVRPDYVGINPVSLDIEVVFVVPRTGVIVVVPQQ
jgi:hypothetical protein